MKTHAGEGGVDFFFVMQVTQFYRGRHAAEGQGGDKALVDLAQLQAVGDVTVKTQLAAGC
ncbi:hypothetical protein D3C73_1426880 [compost metagenome]